MYNFQPSFFKKLKEDKADLKKIKKNILKQSYLSQKKTEEHLLMLLNKYGRVLKNNAVEVKTNLLQAFKFAEDWNCYDLQKLDTKKLKNWINRDLIKVSKTELIINKETWSLLVCLAYLKATPKESPNHFFLKYLLELYFKEYYAGWELKKELSAKIFSERIRYDLCLQNKEKVIIGEVGGVQVWKVMATLEKGYDVIILPHWTKEKKYPFICWKKKYDFYYFSNQII